MLFRIVILVHVCAAFPLKCPEPAQWSIRARGQCPDPFKYFCLRNDLINGYSENCTVFDFLQPGRKSVLRGGLDADICSSERYQPWPIKFYTNVSTNCIFLKSTCNEEGQVVYDEGNRNIDTTCRCDYTLGFDFLIKPRHQCFCVPSKEDCSCYLKACPDSSFKLEPGYECSQSRINTSISQCRPIMNGRVNRDKNQGIIPYRPRKTNISTPVIWKNFAAISVFFVCIGMILTISIIDLINKLYRKDLPEAINQLQEEDKIKYNKLMQSSKTENRYFVRIMLVGKASAGKTCLLRRLLKESITDVSSTDGVDIVVRRCKINIEDGKWTIGKEIDDDKMARIKRALIINAEDSDKQNMQVDETNDTNVSHRISTYKQDITTDTKVNQDNNEEHNEPSSLVMPEDFITDVQVNEDKNKEKNESSSLVMPDDLISHVFSKSTENSASNLDALCELWDFAGQKEFYATHQAFLTSSAVYLVVADMNDDISKQGLSQCFADFEHIGEYVDFWFDSIHCHRTVNERAISGHFDPPILLVFTGKDKYDKADFKKREKELNDQIDQVLRYKSKYHHLQDKFYLSNKEDTDKEFGKLRYAIFENAEKMNNWGKAFPLKWILLEHLIEINKNDGKNFITFTDMLNLAKHPDISLLKENDLLLFLRFQHNVGNIIFFENIRDLIILNPQWLADAFRCLVSDRIDNTRLHHLEDWTLFTRQGKISESLITKLFKSKDGSQFVGQKKNLHKVMEKLDILVKIENSSYYIMPSMMPSSTFDVVCEQFGILSKKCKRTSWLCLKFVFLPPSFFNYLSAWFIRKYDPSKVDSGIGLYRGICMFDIEASGGGKILVTMSTDTIALQVVSFSEQWEEFGSTCSDIYSEVTQLIEEMIKRYKVKISYKLHFKCSDGYYYKDTFAFENLTRDEECFCLQHNKCHRSEKLYSPWMKNEACL